MIMLFEKMVSKHQNWWLKIMGAFSLLGTTSTNFTKSLLGMDETIKLMWHNMIGQSKRIFIESWFTNCQKNDFNFYDPEKCYIILSCEICI